MSEEVLASTHLAERSPPTPDKVSLAIEGFEGIRSRALRWVVRLLPWVILLLVVLEIVWSTPDERDYMFLSGLGAAALGLFLLWKLVQRIPETLGTLWNRGLIAPTKEDQYRTFICDVEDSLHHRGGQLLLGVVCALAGGGWLLLPEPRQWNLSQYGLAGLLLSCIALAFIGFIVGLMAWRVVAIGASVWKLGKDFDLSPDPGHPNRCGGLEPLGNLCLWNAFVLAIPGVYLAFWIIRALAFGYIEFFPEVLFRWLLLVPMVLAIFGFVVPLWSVHQEMVTQRDVVRGQLHPLGQSINDLASKMLDQADEFDPEEAKKMAEELKLMRQIYQQKEQYPVLPFSQTMLVKFVSSQAPTLVALTTLSDEGQDAISTLLESLGKILAP